MKTYTFDVKLWATAYVTAESVEDAQVLLADVDMDQLIPSHGPNGVTFGAATIEGEGDLVEVEDHSPNQ